MCSPISAIAPAPVSDADAIELPDCADDTPPALIPEAGGRGSSVAQAWTDALALLSAIATDTRVHDGGWMTPSAEREAATIAWHFVKRARDAHHPLPPHAPEAFS